MESRKYTFTLGDEVQAYARKMINEYEDTRDDAVEEIKKWLEDHPKLHARTEYESILPFLRGCKFNLEKTKLKLKNYYVLRSEVPEWFKNRDPSLPEIQELIKLGVFMPLRKLHENRLVVVIRTGAHDPKKHSQDNVFKTGKMVLDIAAKESEHCQIYGITAIFDMNNVTLSHALQLKPHMIKKAVFAWQNYHCSPKQLEFINAPVYINVVLNVFKTFMSEKLKSRIRIHFHGLGDLHDLISKDVLPVEFGGIDGNLKETCDYWAEKLLKYKEWFQFDETFKADL